MTKVYIVVAYDAYYPTGNDDVKFVTTDESLANQIAADYDKNGIDETHYSGRGIITNHYDYVEVIEKELN